MTAVILATGVTRRLAPPLTNHTQKSLLFVGGRAILAWILDALHAAGVQHTGTVVGHCAD
jgi:NDP-sugar pyrophosphorylase family protein